MSWKKTPPPTTTKEPIKKWIFPWRNKETTTQAPSVFLSTTSTSPTMKPTRKWIFSWKKTTTMIPSTQDIPTLYPTRRWVPFWKRTTKKPTLSPVTQKPTSCPITIPPTSYPTHISHSTVLTNTLTTTSNPQTFLTYTFIEPSYTGSSTTIFSTTSVPILIFFILGHCRTPVCGYGSVASCAAAKNLVGLITNPYWSSCGRPAGISWKMEISKLE